jgi:hypothetical protein
MLSLIGPSFIDSETVTTETFLSDKKCLDKQSKIPYTCIAILFTTTGAKRQLWFLNSTLKIQRSSSLIIFPYFKIINLLFLFQNVQYTCVLDFNIIS